MLSWSCHQDFPACQRKFLIPGKFICQRAYLSDNNNRRCLNSLSVHFCFQSTDCSYHTFLSCRSSFLKDCCRHIRIHTPCKKSAADIFQCGNSHQENQRSFCLCQRLKINIILLSCTFMSCNDMQGRAEISVRHRNSVIRRNRNRRSHSRYNLIRDSILRKKFQFLTASAKKEWISTFKSYYFISFLSLFQKDFIDILLHHGVMACSFSHVDQSCVLRNSCQNAFANQTVIYYHICLLQNRFAL